MRRRRSGAPHSSGGGVCSRLSPSRSFRNRPTLAFGICRDFITAVRHSSRMRSSSATLLPSACASDWRASFSMKSSVNSGTSVSLVHGNCSAGPNWCRKCRMPPLPPASRKVRKVPIKAQRSPQPKRTASSISSTVAMSSRASQSASRQSASIRRSAINPSISLRTISGRIPHWR